MVPGRSTMLAQSGRMREGRALGWPAAGAQSREMKRGFLGDVVGEAMPSWMPEILQKGRVADPGISAVSPKKWPQSLCDEGWGLAGLWITGPGISLALKYECDSQGNGLRINSNIFRVCPHLTLSTKGCVSPLSWGFLWSFQGSRVEPVGRTMSPGSFLTASASQGLLEAWAEPTPAPSCPSLGPGAGVTGVLGMPGIPGKPQVCFWGIDRKNSGSSYSLEEPEIEKRNSPFVRI